MFRLPRSYVAMRLPLAALLIIASVTASVPPAGAAVSPQIIKPSDFASAATRMAAHRAVYTLKLASSPNNAVIAASGTMDYEVIDTCDGWATEQRLVMDVTNNDGQTVPMVSDYSTWEAKNGSKLRFRVRQTTDTAVTLRLSGEANFGAGGGMITYTEPKPSSVKMAAGTLFPMAHTAHIIALAQNGRRFITLPLFDGSSDSGAEDTFVVVTGAIGPTPAGYAALSRLSSNRVSVAFYDHDSLGEQPDYEVAMRYWTNGVADDLRMNFGEFIMEGKLTQFTPSPRPC